MIYLVMYTCGSLVMETEGVAFFTSAGVAVAGGLADMAVTGVVSGAIANAAARNVPRSDPHSQHADAVTTCNHARWMIHKAEQMMYQQNTLEKDVTHLTKQTDHFLHQITYATQHMQKQITAWRHSYKVDFYVVLGGSLAMVIIFVLVAANKGMALRRKLNTLRMIEAKAAVQLARQPAQA